MYTSEAPLVRLLSSQAERRGFHRLKVWAGLSLLLFLAPTVLMALMGNGESQQLRWYVTTFACSMAVLVPVGQLFGDAALLSSLRRGRCLEEVVGTLTPPREVVDQVAFFSLTSVLKMGAAVALPLLVGCLIAASPEDRLEVLVACAAWFPLAAALVLVGSYTMQAAAVWSRKGETGLVATLLAVGLPLVFFVAWESSATLGFAAGALVALGIGGRWLALRGLDRACEPMAPTARRSAARAWSVLKNNPIALREACRRRSGQPMPRHWLIVGGLALLVGWAASGLPGAREVAGLTVGVFAFMQPLFASADTAKAVLLEREGSTMEALASTGLEPRVFVDGWAAAAWFPRLVETFLVMLVAGAVAMVGADGMMYAMLNLPDALARIVLGAYLGLFVAGFARTRRDTLMLLLAAWVGCSIMATMGSGILLSALTMATMTAGGPPEFALPLYWGVAVGLTLLWTVAFRFLALYRVRSLFEPQR